MAGGASFLAHCRVAALDRAPGRHLAPSVTSDAATSMSKSEIVMRLLSAESRIRPADMRADRMSDEDPDGAALSDLRESASIEQDADMVILLHRPDAFERDDPRAGEADLILARHRNAPTSTITVVHQLHYSRFTDLARESPAEWSITASATWSPDRATPP
ncbi:hypothetical protein GCM10023403_28310 [Pseudonocardia benzenivorans]|nr:hypothetical protein PSD17_37500 [Pseudonocardia sp. D17]